MPGTRKVTVNHGWAVHVDGTQHTGGTVVTVPADLAEQWTSAGWVTPTPERKPTTRKRRD